MKIHFLDPRNKREEIREIWLALQANCSHSFFTSWGWIGTWLLHLPPDIAVKFVYGASGRDFDFCCFIVERRAIKHGLFYKNRAFLNATGVPYFDALTIEYNGLLSTRDAQTVSGLFTRADFRHIEEFHFPGMQTASVESLFDDSFAVVRAAGVRSYFVDLDDVRAGSDHYLDRLSANRRGQIRKSIRVAEESGELRIHEATSSREALQMLSRLIQLHQSEWESRGEAGSFSSEFFRGFHEDLIRRRFEAGEIQLLEVKAGDVPVGYLYNFVYQQNVLFYQSGFNYAEKRKARPGMISHYTAILHNLDKGHKKYNFLAGRAQYKESLSTGFDTLHWSVLTRRNTKWRLEALLRGLKRKLS